ncbi:oxygenase MpaB family protein [Mycobacterium sp. PDNC021]|uniref:oxygenase MpaB family protein n=1 Tax=Mycobacterium sp. PDNC021 TaxID=3391399 RepID=UPI003AAA7AC4
MDAASTLPPVPMDVVNTLIGDESGPAIAARIEREQERAVKVFAQGFDGLTVVLAGPANVAMQLAWPEVCYGVMESPVDSGSVTKHPFKRYRTTIGYVAIALFGSQELRLAYRDAVNGSHRHIRSGPDSPVKYNAFNRDLQLWVASCIFYGARDAIIRCHGPLTTEQENVALLAGSRLATTLQVPFGMWHNDINAFWEYWEAGLQRSVIDDRMAAYLRGLVEFDFLAGPLRTAIRPATRMLTWTNVGFLAPPIREQLGYQWTERDERRFSALMRAIGLAQTPLPRFVRTLPVEAMRWNIQLRHRLGKPLV